MGRKRRGPAEIHPFPGAVTSRRLPLSRIHRVGWYATAVMVVLCLVLLWPRPMIDPTPPASEQRRAMLERAPIDLLRLDWSPSQIAGYRDVSGDVIWSTREQRGFLRFEGMPPNDPREVQYQLWIVDPARDEQPVDGGVFDVPLSSGEVVVAIDAKLSILRPRVFSITGEQPGGVVVSRRAPLLVASIRD